MALIKPSAIVQGISGSIGGQTFVNAKTGLVARPRPYRRAASSEKALIQQSYFSNVSRRWRQITEQQRDSWRSLATDFPQTNRIGQTSPWTGYTLYVKVTMNRLRATGSLFDSPPIVAPITVDPFKIPTLTQGGPYQVIFQPNSTPPTVHIQIWGSRHLSFIDPRRPPPFRLVHESFFSNTPFYTVQFFDEWQAAFGSMFFDERYTLNFVYYSPSADLFPRAPVVFLGTTLPD